MNRTRFEFLEKIPMVSSQQKIIMLKHNVVDFGSLKNNTAN